MTTDLAQPRLALQPLSPGGLTLPTNLLIAPIAGYTDLAFRLIARRLGGVGLGCTDLICAHAVLRRNSQTQSLMQTCAEDSPLAVQLFGGDCEPMVEAAKACRDSGAKIIDINMGCPVEKVTSQNGGAALLCDPDATLRLVEPVIAAVPDVVITAKIRLGWDDATIVGPYLAKRLEQAGIQLITVHGRTREMGFGGIVRLDGIAEVVAAALRIPVIGNGDVRSPHDAKRMMERTGCAGVMIGRKALSAPWIFRDTWSFLTTGTIPPAPTLQEKCQIMRDHFHLHVQNRGEHSAICEFRQRISWYAKELNPCRMLREGMRRIQTAAGFEQVMDRFLEWRREQDGE